MASSTQAYTPKPEVLELAAQLICRGIAIATLLCITWCTVVFQMRKTENLQAMLRL